MERKALTQKNTLLQAAQANAANHPDSYRD